MSVDRTELLALATRVWEADVLPALHDYIRIPNVSPAYDPAWADAGHMDRAVELVRSWCASRPVPGLQVDVVALPGRTPVLVMEVAGDGEGDVLLYGHLDKQPPMTGWRAGLGPWEPVREGERLYGRGGADDGYAAFASITAIEVLRALGGRHGRCVVLIEASEESGSPDLPAYVQALADRIGQPELVVCLDSGCAGWDALWVTTSLRGLVGIEVDVGVLAEGVHSGGAGGIVPSSFRLLRALLSRIEDDATGQLLVPELHVEVPRERVAQLHDAAAVIGDPAAAYPWLDGVRPETDGAEAQLRARTWAPAMELVGIEGVPALREGGNVLRPRTAVRLSFRLPPTCDADVAAAALRRELTAAVPAGAVVDVVVTEAASGWHAPPLAPWLAEALELSSRDLFGQPARFLGEGGSIPFIGMLQARFPDAQFVVTGVLGPGTNAHGPNEFLHVPTAIRLTATIAAVLDAHASR